MANDLIIEGGGGGGALVEGAVHSDPAPPSSAAARATAVAALQETAMAKAGTLQLTKEESDGLQADFGDEDFQTGAAGKENLIYIEHAALRDRINKVLGIGQSALIVLKTWNENFTHWNEKKNKQVAGVKVYCRAMLVVRGCYVAEAVGDMDYYPSNATTNYGDAYEGAKTAAFRRCAKELGVGLQAWRKGWCDGWWKRRQKAPAAPRKVDKESGEIREYVAGIVPTGKYAGQPWADVPANELVFMAEKATKISDEMRAGAKTELALRANASEQRSHGPDRDDDTRESLEDLKNDVPF